MFRNLVPSGRFCTTIASWIFWCTECIEILVSDFHKAAVRLEVLEDSKSSELHN